MKRRYPIQINGPMQNLVWGLQWGAWMGVFYALLVFGLVRVDPPDELRISPIAFSLLYLVLGVIAGGLVGLARPWLTSRRNSTVIGALVGIPAMVSLIATIEGLPWTWSGDEMILGSFAGVVMVGALGFKSWDGSLATEAEPVRPQWQDDTRRARKRNRRSGKT